MKITLFFSLLFFSTYLKAEDPLSEQYQKMYNTSQSTTTPTTELPRNFDYSSQEAYCGRVKAKQNLEKALRERRIPLEYQTFDACQNDCDNRFGSETKYFENFKGHCTEYNNPAQEVGPRQCSKGPRCFKCSFSTKRETVTGKYNCDRDPLPEGAITPHRAGAN